MRSSLLKLTHVLILADDNPAARLLSRPGEAIYNSANGLVEGNNRFQVAWLADDERDEYLTQVQNKFGSNGSRPQIIFDGNASANVETSQVFQNLMKSAPTSPTNSLIATAYLGEPVAIKDAISARFRRQSGSNLLIVTRNEVEARGLVAAAFLSLLLQLSPLANDPAVAQIYVLDFIPVDAAYAQVLKNIGDLKPATVKFGRRNQLQDYLTTISQEVERRIEAEESRATPIFLLIYGLQRARDIRQEEDFGYTGTDEPETFNPVKVLTSILRQGPEVGVHTIIECDTVSNLKAEFDYRVLREIGMRVVSQMSSDDFVEMIDSPAAAIWVYIGRSSMMTRKTYSKSFVRICRLHPIG